MKQQRSFPVLQTLRESIYKLLQQNQEANNEPIDASEVCECIELCMKVGLKKISKNETVSVWGLIQWTNVSQQQRYQAWFNENSKEKESNKVQSWYMDMFKDELEQIQSLNINDNQSDSVNHPTPSHAHKNSVQENSIQTTGFNSAVRTVNTLSSVNTTDGKVKAWIRQCLNMHILSACLAALMDPVNKSIITTYFAPGALMCDADAREVFVGLTSALDRLSFGFHINDASFDNVSKDSSTTGATVLHNTVPLNNMYPPSPTTTESQAGSSNNKDNNNEAVDPLRSPNKYHFLDPKAQRLHELLEKTPTTILKPIPLSDMHEKDYIRTPVFGQSIDHLVLSPVTCDLAKYAPEIAVPNLIEGCCRLIDAYALTPQLYASPVQRSRFEQVSHQVENIGTLSVWTSVHHAIIILVKLLKELPEPILTRHLFPKFLEIAALDGDTLKAMELRHVLNQLHWSTKPSLYRIFQTFTTSLRSEYTTISHATETQIAFVFYRVLFPCDHGVHKHSEELQSIMLLLLHQFEFIFQDISTFLHEQEAIVYDKMAQIVNIPIKLHTSIDVSIDVHVQLMDTLRNHLQNFFQVDYSNDIWLKLGFHHTDPLMELKGGGMLVVECLTYFTVEHEEIASQILQQRANLDKKSNYPVASASVYLVRMLCSLLNILNPISTYKQQMVGIGSKKWLLECTISLSMEEDNNNNDFVEESTSSHAINAHICESIADQRLWKLFDEQSAFYRLFGLCFLLFDRNWTRSGATCMDFSTILAETKCQIEILLQYQPHSVTNLWQIWAEKLTLHAEHADTFPRTNSTTTTTSPHVVNTNPNSQYNTIVNPFQRQKSAFAHMRKYKVHYDGGVNVRVGPSVHSDKIGSRECGVVIETVLKAGDWVKIREIPGIPDPGWILTTSLSNGKLLTLVE